MDAQVSGGIKPRPSGPLARRKKPAKPCDAELPKQGACLGMQSYLDCNDLAALRDNTFIEIFVTDWGDN